MNNAHSYMGFACTNYEIYIDMRCMFITLRFLREISLFTFYIFTLSTIKKSIPEIKCPLLTFSLCPLKYPKFYKLPASSAVPIMARIFILPTADIDGGNIMHWRRSASLGKLFSEQNEIKFTYRAMRFSIWLNGNSMLCNLTGVDPCHRAIDSFTCPITSSNCFGPWDP